MLIGGIISVLRVGIMMIYTLKLNRRSVYEQSTVFGNPYTSEAESLGNHLVFGFKDHSIKIGRFGSPFINAFKLEPDRFFSLFTCNLIAFRIENADIYIAGGIKLNPYITAIIRMNKGIVKPFFASLNGIYIPENTRKSEKILIRKISTVAPFQNLDRSF